MTVTVLRAPHLSVQGPQEAYLYIHEQTSSDARASPGKKGQATTVFTSPRLQSQDKQCQQLGMKEWHRLGALTDHCTLPAAAVQQFSLPSICSPSTQHHSQLSAGAGGSLLEPLDLVCPDMGQCWALLTEVIPACSTSITKPCCVSPIQTFSRVYFTVWDFFLNVVYFFFFPPRAGNSSVKHSYSIPSVLLLQSLTTSTFSLLRTLY